MAGKQSNLGDGKIVDIQRKVSLDFLRNSGNFAVQAPRGEKNPGKGWDPRSNSRSKSDQTLYDLDRNDANLGIHLYGNMVDVDVDSDAPYLTEALDNFLPSCSHVWGRKSRPRTHRVYQISDDEPYDPTDWPVLNRLSKIPEANIEIRGGQQTRGEYSLLPGSVHPSGEAYEWADLNRAQNSPSVTDISKIVKGVRFAGAIAVLAPYWTEGVRNNLVMALSGFLYKAHEIAEGIGGSAFSMDKDEADRFLHVLLALADPNTADRGARLATFQMTWRKAQSGAAVTGATTIAEITGDKTIVGKLYTLLTDSPDIAAVEEFTSRFAIWQGPGVVIDMDQARNGMAKPVMTRQSFVNSFSHRAIDVGGKRRLLADVLFNLETTTRVAGLTMMPGEPFIVDTREGRKINQWSGFELKPFDGTVKDSEVRMFLDYVLDVLADGDKKLYEWIVSWLANLLQDPAKKTGTALVLVGKPGAGKSFLGHRIIMPMIGDTHAASTKSVESITRGFNALFDNKVFVCCDEAVNNRQKATTAKLKSIVTDPYIEIEPKGMDPYFKPNHMRLMFTSNDVDDAISLEDGNGDRRYTVAEVSNKYVNKVEEFWIPFVTWLDGNRPKVMRWLLDYHYTPALISTPYVTAAKANMQQRSWPAFDAWLATWLGRGHPLAENNHEFWHDALPKGFDKKRHDILRQEWPEYVSMTALVKDYTAFCRAYARNEHLLNEMQLGIQLTRRKLKQAEDSRIRLMVEDYDARKGVKVKKSVALHLAPTKKKVQYYLETNFSFDASSLDTSIEEAVKDLGPGDAHSGEY